MLYRPLACVAALLLLLPAPSLAQAQGSTADGIAALIRNDPATAVRILAPPTTSSARADPLATFFRAALNETGFDARGDLLLTCGLYLSAAGSATPLMAPARAHVQTLQREDPELAGLCKAIDDRPAGSEPETVSVANDTGSRDTQAGVAAFIAGDYQTAGSILKPIAERNRRQGVDAVATFFAAAMYQSGIGLPHDPVKACALYMRAGLIYSNTGTWFERLNANFARDAFSDVPAAEQGSCHLLGSIGFDHRFEPATFFLGPQHSVAFTLSSDGVEAAVSYQGRERRQPLGNESGDGLVFLPLQYTELRARSPALGRRHFVEILEWVPGSDTKWRLHWTLVEIVGDSVETVERRDLIDSADPDAPSAPLDLRSIVVVRNDDLGRAEWAVLAGPDARRAFIPTGAELSEIRAENEARAQRKPPARPRVPLTFPRSPAFHYVDADGCASLFAFTWSADGAEVLTVRADRDALRLSADAPRTFDLSAAGPDLEVEARVSNRAGYDWGLCKDYRGRELDDEDEAWRAVSGLLTIQIAPAGLRVSQPWRYRASISLTGAEFVGPTGMRVRVPGPITIATWVGSLEGPTR